MLTEICSCSSIQPCECSIQSNQLTASLRRYVSRVVRYEQYINSSFRHAGEATGKIIHSYNMANLTAIIRLSFRPTQTLIFRQLSTSSVCGSKNVGFIGLGNMGGPMALNLINKGNKVMVYDVFPDAMVKMQYAGAQIGQHPAELAEKSDVIITMLPNNAHVMEAYTGENGIFKTVKQGALLIDSSTIDPSVARDVSNLASQKQATFFDAPVSGGVMAAKAGTLTFMVGGPESEFAKAKDVLTNIGKNIVYCGSAGSGQAAKICNNMLLAITMVGTAEAMNLGIRLGLDPKLLSGIINTSSGRNWSSEVYNPVPGVLENVPASNNYQGGFGTALMTKDLGLAQNSATRSSSPIPLGALAHQIYRLMAARGYGGKDFSSVYQFLQEMNTEKN